MRNSMDSILKRSAIPLFLLVLISSGCTTKVLVRSHWDKNEITVDGDEKDWSDRTFYLKEEGISLGVRNDNKDLFLFFKTADREQIRNIRLGGLTIWLDPAGSNGKKYGIGFPPRPMNVPPGADEEDEFISDGVNEVRIFTDGKKDPVLISLSELKGIQCSVSYSANVLIVECRIPIADDPLSPIKLNATRNDIGITLESDKIDMKIPKNENAGLDEGQAEPGGFSPGGNTTGGGRRGGRGLGAGEGSERGRGKHSVVHPLDFWFLARLAPELK